MQWACLMLRHSSRKSSAAASFEGYSLEIHCAKRVLEEKKTPHLQAMALLLQAHPVPGAKRGRFHAPVMTTERRALITTGKRGEDRAVTYVDAKAV